jgi:hypothetical protein
MVPLQAGWAVSHERIENDVIGLDLPNFFLMTLRIFFWSNFFGRPWTVVNVLRPLRSAGDVALERSKRMGRPTKTDAGLRRTLDPNMDVILGLPGFPSVFVGFGEGVCYRCTD